MSYDIIYQRAFIKTTTGILPMVLIGSNNVTETTYDARGRAREVRAKEWTALHLNQITNASKDTFLNYIEQTFDESEHELFRFHDCWVHAHQAYAWYKRGISEAQCLETYLVLNPRLLLECAVYRFKDPTSYCYSKEHLKFCATTEELEAWLNTAQDYIKVMHSKSPDETLGLTISFSSHKPIRVPPIGNGKVVIKIRSSKEYISDFVSGEYYNTNWDRSKASVFDSAVDAVRKTGFCGDDFIFEKVECAPQKPRNFVLQITDGEWKDKFIYKKTKSKLYSIGSEVGAKHFLTVASAKRCAESLLETSKRVKEIAILNTATRERILL